jgi:TRAP-type C4-dicarboxylate transport system substrate-binding protein
MITALVSRMIRQAGIAAAVATAALPALNVLPVRAQTYTMKIGADTVNDVQHEWLKRFGGRVEQRSAGRIKAQFYPSAQLGGSAAEIKGMQLGTIEARIGPGAFMGGLDPRFQVLDAPGWFVDMEHVRRTMADPKFRNAFFEVPKSKGLIGVSLVVYGPSSFVSKQPLRSLADFRGKKIRVMGSPMQTTPIRQLGGTASPIAWAETLPALQQGMIDGVKSALPAFTSVKFYDAAKYLTTTDDSVLVSVGLVSKVWFDRLPADLQKIIIEEGSAVESELLQGTMEAYARSSKEWIDNGGEIIKLAADEQNKLREQLAGVGPEVLKDQPQVKALYDLLIEAAKANR